MFNKSEDHIGDVAQVVFIFAVLVCVVIFLMNAKTYSDFADSYKDAAAIKNSAITGMIVSVIAIPILYVITAFIVIFAKMSKNIEKLVNGSVRVDKAIAETHAASEIQKLQEEQDAEIIQEDEIENDLDEQQEEQEISKINYTEFM